MFKTILIATDGSEVGDKAVVQGVEVAKGLAAKLTIVKVTEMWSAVDIAGRDALTRIENYETAASDAAKKILANAADVAKKAGVECKTLHVPDMLPADGIIDAANRIGADLIVMGSHGRRGINRLLLGSQAHNVLNQAKITVMICR
ncbi:MAG: universal stress protein [Hyphomicrobiaceae bacterium]